MTCFMDMGATAIIVTFLAANTGALIYFAGQVKETLRNHEMRIENYEMRCNSCGKIVIRLAMKAGM